MSAWIDFWHNLTPGQGTLLGGAFVLCAGVIAFSTGALDRRSQHQRFHYEEMKTLYVDALRIGRDLEIVKALPPETRREVLVDKADAIDRVISELAVTGNFQTADIAIAYAYQQSVQLGEWVKQVEGDGAATAQLQKWLDTLPEQHRAALQIYEEVTVNRRDVVQAVRQELALYVPVLSRYRRALRETLRAERFPLN
ncbi:hypothetical protein BN1232_05472 [Mycobacterium lentiflavum]|uniref:Uncharacterized protein n=1 Tax=Mycobacterium lentiflavum TaxID=141349 RepID=A0A0E4H1V2_MYCLN|nr:hypothetical protein [Mycobacterium lentiflavum]CQD22037.1 hypothetical protein BN1232_05472 [Mycobacterium lentiflavum]